MLKYTCYMTDGSGAYHMKYNVPNADRLGEESGRAVLFIFRVNFPKNPISMRKEPLIVFF